jgi:hypothetical protein
LSAEAESVVTEIDTVGDDGAIDNDVDAFWLKFNARDSYTGCDRHHTNTRGSNTRPTSTLVSNTVSYVTNDTDPTDNDDTSVTAPDNDDQLLDPYTDDAFDTNTPSTHTRPKRYRATPAVMPPDTRPASNTPTPYAVALLDSLWNTLTFHNNTSPASTPEYDDGLTVGGDRDDSAYRTVGDSPSTPDDDDDPDHVNDARDTDVRPRGNKDPDDE